jgi:hypothetical protein
MLPRDLGERSRRPCRPLEHVPVRLWRGCGPRTAAHRRLDKLGHRWTATETVLDGRGDVSSVNSLGTLPVTVRETPLAGGSSPGTRRPVRGGRTEFPEKRDQGC